MQATDQRIPRPLLKKAECFSRAGPPDARHSVADSGSRRGTDGPSTSSSPASSPRGGGDRMPTLAPPEPPGTMAGGRERANSAGAVSTTRSSAWTSSSDAFTRVMAQKWPSTSRSACLPCRLLKKSCASILRFSINKASIRKAKLLWKSMRALHWESSDLASSCKWHTWPRISAHFGHAEPLTSSTPPVYAESGSGRSSSRLSRSGNNRGGIVVCRVATSELSRLISVRNHAQCDLRKAQNGQSSLSKRSA
mmetsp:Transcript_87212/g.266892  ORF Transcript_87212/g.266892 Transcript_87212/m.266892 type:complete len:251 (-) Transcript_87212:126-878(-)